MFLQILINILMLTVSSYLYTIHIKESTYCLWDKSWISVLDENDKAIDRNGCQYGECNEMICNSLWNIPGAAFVKISMLEPSSRQLHYTYIDTLWIILLTGISCLTLHNIIFVFLTDRREKSLNNIQAEFTLRTE